MLLVDNQGGARRSGAARGGAVRGIGRKEGVAE